MECAFGGLEGTTVKGGVVVLVEILIDALIGNAHQARTEANAEGAICHGKQDIGGRELGRGAIVRLCRPGEMLIPQPS